VTIQPVSNRCLAFIAHNQGYSCAAGAMALTSALSCRRSVLECPGRLVPRGPRPPSPAGEFIGAVTGMPSSSGYSRAWSLMLERPVQLQHGRDRLLPLYDLEQQGPSELAPDHFELRDQSQSPSDEVKAPTTVLIMK
jgi:hypothetical protein